MKIIVIEDAPYIRESIGKALKENGYEVQELGSAQEVRGYFQGAKTEADLVLLDVALGDGNGFFLVEDGTIPKTLPVVFLTVQEEEEDVLKGFSLGAEDYIRKPFSMRELLARVKRILGKEAQRHTIRAAGLCIDLEKNTVSKGAEEIRLSPIERRLLMVLAESRGTIVSREILLDCIWEWTGNDVDDHTLTVYMNRLKTKVGGGVFETVRGTGYRLSGEKA